MRVAVGGLCRAGKTTLAARLGAELGVKPRHTDDLIGFEPPDPLKWGKLASRWFDEPGPWVIEGVQVPFALDFRRRNGLRPALDRLIWCKTPYFEPSGGQKRLNRRICAVFCKIREYLDESGVEVIEYDGQARTRTGTDETQGPEGKSGQTAAE